MVGGLDPRYEKRDVRFRPDSKSGVGGCPLQARYEKQRGGGVCCTLQAQFERRGAGGGGGWLADEGEVHYVGHYYLLNSARFTIDFRNFSAKIWGAKAPPPPPPLSTPLLGKRARYYCYKWLQLNISFDWK